MEANDEEILEGFEKVGDEFLLEKQKPASPNALRNISPYAYLNNKNAGDAESPGDDQEMDESSKSKSTGRCRADVRSARTEKNKVIWTRDLHKKFLEAIQKIGIDRAVPKKILELMQEEGLTRDNIASHLQKYRIFLKKIEEANYGIQITLQPVLLESSMTNGSPSSSSMLDQTMPQQKNWPSYGGMQVINPSILDTSFSVLEASSFNATMASKLTHSCSLPNLGYSLEASALLIPTSPNSPDEQMNLNDDESKLGDVSPGCVNPVNLINTGFMQNLDGFMYDHGGSAADVYPYISTGMGSSTGLNSNNELPISGNQNSNGFETSRSEFVESSDLENGIGEDDLILDAGVIASLCETFMIEEPYVDGNTSQTQPVTLDPLNQDVKEQYIQNMVPFDSSYNGYEVNEQHRSIEEKTNNYMYQTSDGFDPTINMRYDGQLMESMWTPEPIEEDLTFEALFQNSYVQD